jgi:hypothetical protein
MRTEVQAEETTKRLELLENSMYRHLHRWCEQWKNTTLFTESGFQRLASIAGYIQALRHAEKEELATALLNDWYYQMEWLAGHTTEVKIPTGNDKYEVVKLPSRKTVLSDDGCLHSFSFVSYFLVAPERYDERLAYHQNELDKQRSVRQFDGAAHQAVVKELNILERLNARDPYSNELTETRYCGNRLRQFYYCRGYNGGLIYHGPGAGENFSVLISNRPTLWSIHT